MPASWRGFSGGMGRGAIGAASVFMDYSAQSQAGQSVAPMKSLTTLRRKCGIYAVGGHTQGGASRRTWHRVDPRVTYEAINVTDRDIGGMGWS